MALAEQIQEDIKVAMKAKKKDKLSALRDIKSKLLLEATNGQDQVDEAAEVKILQKLHKQRMESYKIYQEQNREDLAEVEKFQADIIEQYLPQMMDEAEIEKAVEAKIQELGVDSMADMGKVMGALMKDLEGKADGNLISKHVKAKLQ